MVITDVEECLPALQSNLEANLPEYVQLQRVSTNDKSAVREQEANGWDLPSSVLDTLTQGEQLRDCSPTVASCSDEDPGRLPDGLQPGPQEQGKPDRQPAVEGNVSGKSHPTRVYVEKLDWREDASFLHPPFDLLLLADVVNYAPCHLY